MKDLRPDQAAPKSGEGKRVRQEVSAPGPV